MPQTVFDALAPEDGRRLVAKERFEARVKGVEGPLALVRVGLRMPPLTS